MATDDDADGVVVELEANEVALIIGEAEGSMSVRVVTGAEISDGNPDLPAAPEIVLALAMRLLKDPEFHDDVLDWYYEHQDEVDDEEQEEE
jgi:hypothetical protein